MMTGDINKAIDQLADRLGVAADKIVDVVPHYAQMKAATGVVGIIVMLVFAAFGIGLGVWGARMCAKDKFDEVGWTMALVGFIAAASLVVIACIVLCDVIGWTCYPDAKVAELIVSKL